MYIEQSLFIIYTIFIADLTIYIYPFSCRVNPYDGPSSHNTLELQHKSRMKKFNLIRLLNKYVHAARYKEVCKNILYITYEENIIISLELYLTLYICINRIIILIIQFLRWMVDDGYLETI